MIQFATSLVGMAEVIAAESKSETRRSIKKGLKGPAKHKVPRFFTIVKMLSPTRNKKTGERAKFGKVVYYLMADGMIRPLPPKPMYGHRSESPGEETMMEAMGKTIRYVRPDKAEEMMHKHNMAKAKNTLKDVLKDRPKGSGAGDKPKTRDEAMDEAMKALGDDIRDSIRDRPKGSRVGDKPKTLDEAMKALKDSLKDRRGPRNPPPTMNPPPKRAKTRAE